MSVSMAPEDIYARLQRVSDLADLRPERRLDSKLDMSSEGIYRRIELASQLSDLCNTLRDSGRVAELARSIAVAVGAHAAELDALVQSMLVAGSIDETSAATLLAQHRAGR